MTFKLMEFILMTNLYRLYSNG